MSPTIAVRLPDELNEDLEKLAKEIDRKKSYIVRKATELYLQEYADHLIALERQKDLRDETISSDELRRRLGIPR